MSEVDSDTYKFTAMCPPGKIKYFFTINKMPAFARNHEKKTKKFPKIIRNIVVYDEVKNFKISKFNTCIVEQGQSLDQHYMSLLKE